MKEKELFISVIVPVYNGAKFLPRCLEGLSQSLYRSYEIIVVDDASTDHSLEIARSKGARVLHLQKQSGPAAARNQGAKIARGDILLFIDADVVAQIETLDRVASHFKNNSDLAALFGSYDDKPDDKGFLSQYRNLLHHYVHQNANPEAMTFWAGCGAVRKEVFEKVGGFDQERYPRPEIEDIDLGYRMRIKGYRILLDKGLQVKHLKRWQFVGMLQADIFCRAIPWSKLILERRQMANDLNLKTSDRISAGLVGISVLVFPLSIFEPGLLSLGLFLIAIIFFLNRDLHLFFLNRKGLRFVSLAFPMHLLYFFYSGVVFSLCWLSNALARKEKTS